MLCDIHYTELRNIGGEFVCVKCLAESSKNSVGKMALMREKQDIAIFKAKISASGIPHRFINSSFENFIPPNSRAAKLPILLKQYCENFEEQRLSRPGLVFIGLQGRGKTHLACAMALHLVNKFCVKYVSLPELTRRTRATYVRDAQEKLSNIIHEMVSADFLIMDEIDLHGASDSDYQVLYDIVNGRYEQGDRPTLVISNRDLERLRADLDDRIISRLLGGAPAINFEWESHRDKQYEMAKSISTVKQ